MSKKKLGPRVDFVDFKKSEQHCGYKEPAEK